MSVRPCRVHGSGPVEIHWGKLLSAQFKRWILEEVEPGIGQCPRIQHGNVSVPYAMEEGAMLGFANVGKSIVCVGWGYPVHIDMDDIAPDDCPVIQVSQEIR